MNYKRFYAAPTKQLLKAHNKQESDSDDDDDDDDDEEDDDSEAETNSDDDPEPDESEVIEIKEVVKQFFNLHRDVKKLEEAIRERKKTIAASSKKILAFMRAYGITNMDTAEGNKLRYTVTKRKEGISQKNIKSKLADYFNDVHKAEEIFCYILDNRATKESVSLRKVFAK
jgi:hypothetical protein